MKPFITQFSLDSYPQTTSVVLRIWETKQAAKVRRPLTGIEAGIRFENYSE
jgi:hypothetical protein